MKLRSRREVGTFIVARGRIATLALRLLGASALAAVATALWLAPAPALLSWFGAGIGVLAAMTAGSGILGAIRDVEDVRLRVNMDGIAVSPTDGLMARTYRWEQVLRVVVTARICVGSGDEPTIHTHCVVVHLDPAPYSGESTWARARAGREWMITGELIARGSFVAGEEYRTAEAIKQACPRHIPVEMKAECSFAGVQTMGRLSRAQQPTAVSHVGLRKS